MPVKEIKFLKLGMLIMLHYFEPNNVYLLIV